MRAIVFAVALAGSAIAADIPADSPLKPICDLMCGSWVQEEVGDDHGAPPAASEDDHNSDAFALELHWDAASGELRGTQTVSGGPNGTVKHDIAFRADPKTKEVVLTTTSPEYLMRTESAVELADANLRVFSLAPGNPTISSLVQWAFVEADRMVATRAESAAGYNHFFGDQIYRKVK